MSKADNLKDFLTDIANAIRFKTNKTAKLNPQNFANEIKNINSNSTSTIVIQQYSTRYGNDIY